MKKLFLLIYLMTLFPFAAVAEEVLPYQVRESPPDFQLIIGPRVGVNYFNLSEDEFSEKVNEIYPNSGDYFPVTSTFGVNVEQRILLGETRSHFVFQELFVLHGIEQSIILPSFSFLIGFRASSGFEFGTGVTFSVTGISVIMATGWTFEVSEVYVPVDLSVVIPNKKRPMSVALTTGFNFLIKSRKKAHLYF